MPSVFLSYRHDPPGLEHSQRVRDLAQQLLDAGLTVVLDAIKHKEEWNHGGPPKGWTDWSREQLEPEINDKVLIITSSGTVKLRQCLANCGDECQDTELPRTPIPTRDHQPRCLALLPILSELPVR